MLDIALSPRLGLLLLAALLIAAPVQAQIVTDGSVGPKVSLQGGQIEIGADLGTRRGDNLFHSFEKFNIATGQTATLTGPGDIKNVISRVTGGEISTIDGTLASKVGQADLYFLNPAGVMFGPNARLDVPGSFHVSTAAELRFADGARFSALDKTGSGLTVAPPEAFGFLDRPPGRIAVNHSQLQLAPGKALSLAGGDIDITGGLSGTLSTLGGTVTLTSLTGAGQSRVSDGVVNAARQGTIHLTNQARIDTRGNGGGTIRIRGGTLAVENSSISADNAGDRDSATGIDLQASMVGIASSSVSTDVYGSGRSGTVTVKAGDMVVRAGTRISSSTYATGQAGTVSAQADHLFISGAGSQSTTTINSSAERGSSGAAGTVTVSARELELYDGGQIAGATYGAGLGGQVSVTADRLRIAGTGAGFPSGIGSSTAPGLSSTAGTVTVTARELELHDGGQIASRTFGAGLGGQVTVTANRLRIAGKRAEFPSAIGSSAASGSSGAAGMVTVTAGELELLNSGEIASGTFGTGPGGQVTVTADRLRVAGVIGSSATRGSSGAAGTVTVSARELELHDGGQIAGSTFGAGPGGQVTVTADRLRIAGERAGFFSIIFSSAAPGSSGAAGTVTVTAGELKLHDGGQIASTTSGPGNAGTVTVTAGELELHDGGQIAGSTFGAGPGGQVTVTADRLRIAGERAGSLSIIASSAAPGSSGAAGTVMVTAGELELHDGGQIAGATFGAGPGGQVTVTADRLRIVGGRAGSLSTIASSAAPGSSGAAGTVMVTAGELELHDGGQIASDTFAEGKAGAVTVQADRLVIKGVDAAGLPSTIASSAEVGSTGAGGAVTIRAQNVVLRDRGAVTTASDGTGTGGPILISAADTLRLDNAAIEARTVSARGGDVTLAIGRLFDLHNSTVTTSVAGGTGSGGNIFTNPHLMVLDDSRIEANAQRGSGGNITIQASHLIRTPDSVIQASSAQSVSGTITITAPSTDVAGSLVVLPGTLFDVSSELSEACAARGGRPASSFAPGGRGGLPPDPGAPLVASPFEQPLEQQTATRSPTPLTSRTPQAAKPIIVSGIPQPVLGSPRLACQG
jgi:filamentous hemagglutinin family protein